MHAHADSDTDAGKCALDLKMADAPATSACDSPRMRDRASAVASCRTPCQGMSIGGTGTENHAHANNMYHIISMFISMHTSCS